MKTKFTTHLADVLFDKERSLLPATQILIERQNALSEARQKVEATQTLRTQLVHKITSLEREFFTDESLSERLLQLYQEDALLKLDIIKARFVYARIQADKKPAERQPFVRNCPVAQCRGFFWVRCEVPKEILSHMA